jgi:hypothetical protein
MATDTLFDVKAHWCAMVAMAEAAAALERARDLIVVAQGNSTPAASVHILAEAAAGLLSEMGAQLVALRNSGDEDARALASQIIAALHEQGAPVSGQDA